MNVESSSPAAASMAFFSLRRSMLVAGAAVLLGILATGMVIFQIINTYRIGSENYQIITENKDFLSDFSPAALLPYKAALIIHESALLEPSRAADMIDDFEKNKKDYYAALDTWRKMADGRGLLARPEWKALFDDLKAKGDIFWDDSEKTVLPAVLSKAPGREKMMLRATLEFQDIENLVTSSMDMINKRTQEIETSSTSGAFRGLSLITAIGFALIIAIAGLLMMAQRRVVHAIVALSGVMSDLARGNLNALVPFATRRDEIGLMARAVEVFKGQALAIQSSAAENEKVISHMGVALENLSSGNLAYELQEPFSQQLDALRLRFNDAVHTLKDVINSVKSGTDGIATGTEEIALASDDLSRRTETQAASLEETAAAVAELTTKVKQTASGASQARNMVEQAKADADHSGQVVGRAVAAMTQIEDSSRKITQIISVIDEIAFQTNLLALNAGVEAARAGDAGRGFAVVASEVRALAQRSADAAREIKSLLASSHEAVEQGVKLVSETGNSLRSIIARVTDINAVIAEIASSAEQQASGLLEVNSTVDQMDQVTQQNAAMVEETTAATRTLTDQSAELARLVSRFATEPGFKAA